MSRSVNRVTLIGHLGADPELRSTTSGKAVANINLATNEVWKDGKGEKQERTEWHRLVLWGNLAEIAREYLKKGDLIYVEGRIQTRSWDKDGETKYTTEINVKELVMLGGKNEKREVQQTPAAVDAEFANQPLAGEDDLPI